MIHSSSHTWLHRLAAKAIALAATGFLVLGIATGNASAAGGPPTIDNLFSHPRFAKAALSPDGTRIAVIARVGERLQLSVIDLDANTAKPVAGYSDADIVWFRWLSNKRLLFTIADMEVAISDKPGSGWYAVNSDGTGLRELMPTPQKQVRSGTFWRDATQLGYIARIRGSEDVLVRTYNDRTEGFLVKLMDTHTGRSTNQVLGIKGKIIDADADAAGVLRSITSVNDEGQVQIWYRANASQDWASIASFESVFAPDAWAPVGFAADGKTMWVTGYRQGDKAAIHVFDLGARKITETAVSHPAVDIDGPMVFESETGEVLGLRIVNDKPETVWFSEAWARIQATVDAALPGRVNALSGDEKKRVLVYSYSDRDPGRYYLFDVAKRSLTEILPIRPEIDPQQAAPSSFFRYKARDGMEIPAYLTMPLGASKPPLVVLVHGGPYGLRDRWGFDAEVQFLASEGYAVLQPQFRGSGGFGRKHEQAGWQQWGLAMQDDLADGVRQLISEGRVDPARICIMGASYGGYAAMMGLVKDPDLFRCAVNFAGVADVRLLYSITYSDIGDAPWQRAAMKRTHGDPEKLQEQFEQTSPIAQAARIRGSALLAYSSEDYRVPIEHGKKLRDALRDAGKAHEWHALVGEGHGIGKESTTKTYYRYVARFLRTHLGAPITTK